MNHDSHACLHGDLAHLSTSAGTVKWTAEATPWLRWFTGPHPDDHSGDIFVRASWWKDGKQAEIRCRISRDSLMDRSDTSAPEMLEHMLGYVRHQLPARSYDNIG